MEITSNREFRRWLEENHDKETEVWICVQRGKPTGEGFWYLDAVETALCFGWIDGTCKKADGRTLQRFSPRQKKSVWSELNKERVRRLEKLGLMTDAGRKVLPRDMNTPFQTDDEIKRIMTENGVWEIFLTFPPLYRRVRAYNLAFYKNKKEFDSAIKNFLEKTKQGQTYGEWNDYGRLLDY